MKKVLLLLYCLIVSGSLAAQLKIGPNTSIKGGSQAIITTGMAIDNTSALVSLPVLQLENKATIATSQEMLIAAGLRLYSGIISFAGEGRVLYGGPADNLDYNGENYILSGFYARGKGARTYPVGTANELADIKLKINGDDPGVITSVNVFDEDPGLNQDAIPAGVDAVSSNWYWQMEVEGDLISATPTLSVNNPDYLLPASSGDNATLIVLEANESKGAVKKLGRRSASTEQYITASQGGVGPYFLLGVTKDIQLVINQIITPDNDGVNDYLEVQNLDVFAGSYEVMLIDRLGALVWSSKRLHEGNINFSFLEPGNYVCIVNYAGNTAKQMITVLK
jgi:hypothetical protein